MLLGLSHVWLLFRSASEYILHTQRKVINQITFSESHFILIRILFARPISFLYHHNEPNAHFEANFTLATLTDEPNTQSTLMSASSTSISAANNNNNNNATNRLPRSTQTSTRVPENTTTARPILQQAGSKSNK